MIKVMREMDRRMRVFMPISKFMIGWYLTIMLVIVIDFYFTVLLICFRSQTAANVIAYFTLPFLLIICILDIFFSFNTSFIQRGRIITDKTAMRLKYIKSSYFYFDAIALVIVFCQLIFHNIFQTELPFLNFLIFIKVFKVKKFDTLIQKYVIRSKSWQLFYQIIKHLLLLILICHLIGSFFFYLDIKLIEMGWYQPEQLWVYNSYAYKEIINLPIPWQYAYSFYYAIITLSGCAYGDLTPLNQTQVAYTCFSLALPMIVYAYMFSIVYRAIGDQQARSMQTKQYKKIITKYFKENGIEPTSATRFTNYLTYAFERKNTINNQYLNQVAPKLKSSFIQHVLDNEFDFSIFNPLITIYSKFQEIKQIAYQTAEEEPYPSKYIFNMQKSKSQKLFFIISGEVSQYVIIRQQKLNKILKSKSFYGQYTFYTGIIHSHQNHLFQANDFTVCQTIDYLKFRQAIKQKTSILQSYFNLRNKLIFQNELQSIKILCFFCESSTHIIDKCPKLRINIEPSQASIKNNARTPLIRGRRQFKKYYYYNEPLKLIGNFFASQKKAKVYEEKNIQTQFQQGNRFMRNKPNCMNIQIVENWKHFQPFYSFHQLATSYEQWTKVQQ